MTLNEVLKVLEARCTNLNICVNGEELALTPRLTAIHGCREIEEISVLPKATLKIRVRNVVKRDELITAINSTCGYV